MRRTTTLLFALLLASGAFVQRTARADTTSTPPLPSPPAPDKPADKPPAKPKAPGELVSFQVEDADLPDLVKTIGELTGKRFVVATAKPKTLKATVYATQKVTVEEAYRAFLSMLQGPRRRCRSWAISRSSERSSAAAPTRTRRATSCSS